MAHPPLDTPGLTLERTRTSNSSDYVLLTHERSPLLPPSTSSPHPLATTTSLPRPRFVWVLQLACLVDLVAVLVAGAKVPLSALPKSAVGLSVARPVFVTAVVSSKRVRSMGPLLLGQTMVSLLVLLFRVNELVQTSSALSLSAFFSLTSPKPSVFPVAHLPHLSHLLNPTSRWYLLSFAFSLLHYALFAIFVGVRRRRNPFVGGGGRGMRRSAAWGEQEWAGREEVVGGPGLTRSRTRTFSRTSRLWGEEPEMEPAQGQVDVEEGELEEELEEGDERSDLDDTDVSSSEDEDDIVDIPRTGALGGGGGTLRNRASRASLLSMRGGGVRREEGSRSPPLPQDGSERPPGLRASRGFGSMRSLAGI